MPPAALPGGWSGEYGAADAPGDSAFRVKLFILATFACAFGRLVSNDPYGALTDLFSGFFGAFYLREDAHLQVLFQCLRDSPLGSLSEGSEGSASFLLPLMSMSALNVVFSTARLYAMLSRFGSLLPCTARPDCYLPLWLLLSTGVQIALLVACWPPFKQLQQGMLSNAYMRTPEDASDSSPPPSYAQRHQANGHRGSAGAGAGGPRVNGRGGAVAGGGSPAAGGQSPAAGRQQPAEDPNVTRNPWSAG